MPIYEYQCPTCGETFSHLWRSINRAQERAAPACPHCGEAETRRIVSQVAVLNDLGGLTPAEARDRKAQEDRLSQITPKDQIDTLRAGKKGTK